MTPTAGPAEQPEVSVGAGRVALEVLARAELNRVHEHAHHDTPVLLARSVDQAHVAGVQCAHGRDQPD
jgi:hypothetical protein